MKQFSIQITTKNRLEELKISLKKISFLLSKKDIEIIIYDDGSNDGTAEFINENYSNVIFFRNEKSKGLIHCRNYMLNYTKADYSISLDDDSNFVSDNFIEIIKQFFQQNEKCGVIATRIFWGKQLPENTFTKEFVIRVKSFVGCGHVWNMKAWRSIPDYPAWFIFYGEEDFASYQLFLKDWLVLYVPDLLVHHRVEVSSRKNNSDYITRTRRALRAGWYLMFLFYPWYKIPRLLLYSVWMQMKLKVFKGDLKALKGLFLAKIDLFFNIFKLLKYRQALTINQYSEYNKLDETKVYWKV